MSFEKITESVSNYQDLEKMSVSEILTNINNEDKTVANSVALAKPQIEVLVNAVTEKLTAGGRLFYIGAGTSGRLGVLDASECPPTYGVSKDVVTGVIAGGDAALHTGIEDAEDDQDQGWRDLLQEAISVKDVLVGIAASGATPYVWNALKQAQKNGIVTGCIVCNPGSEVARYADYPVEVIVGPEFVTGSTRMKSGTAQKLILNMITTTAMIKLGKVEGNRMIHMQLSNDKLVDRGVKMLMERTGLTYERAKIMLLEKGDIPSALAHFNANHE